jgi:hypothetical protein
MQTLLDDYKQQLLTKVPSIVEVEIPTPPDHYESYLYLFTNLLNGKRYLGIHKGIVYDFYYNSSKNSEFREDYTNAKSKFRYEVLEYGDHSQMSFRETAILTAANAKDSSDWYNRSNGGAIKDTLRMNVVKQMVKRITDGEFDCKDANGDYIKEPKKEIYKLDRLQVREVQYIPELVKSVVDRIEDRMGNTDDCTPILIYESRLEPKLIKGKRRDLIGDGNNTIEAVNRAKSAHSVKVARIPYEIHKDLSNQELRAIGGLLNPEPEIRKISSTPADAVKYIVGVYDTTSLPADCAENMEYLRAVGFNSNQIKNTIIPNAINAIEKKQFELSNQIFIEYGTGSKHRPTLIAACEGYKNSDTHAEITSSSHIRLDRLMTNFRIAHQLNSKKKNLVVVIHHPNPKAKKDWDSNVQALHNKEVEFWIKERGFGFQWVEMPHLMENKLVN